MYPIDTELSDSNSNSVFLLASKSVASTSPSSQDPVDEAESYANKARLQQEAHPVEVLQELEEATSKSGSMIMNEMYPKPHMDPSVNGKGFSLFNKQTPDDKLLEALDSPKDRIFLLRLEQDLITFVKDSKEPYIDLPPCNSFCRLLTHKLADYYYMTHQYDNVTQSVRIFRTPFCRLPQPLTSIPNPPTPENTPPAAMPVAKIMRGGGDAGTGGSPSKPTSPSGARDSSKNQKDKQLKVTLSKYYTTLREYLARSLGLLQMSLTNCYGDKLLTEKDRLMILPLLI
jgi:hypothetical protein